MNSRTMASPEPTPNPWWIVLSNLLPWITLYGLTHTAIFYVFKYWSDSRDERIDKRIDAKLKPINDKLDEMHKDLIAAMKK